MTNKLRTLLKYPTSIVRLFIVLINNAYCIPTYVIWMGVLTPLKKVQPEIFYKVEGIFFHWLLAVVSMWSYTAGYDIVEVGDDIEECMDKRTLIIANHQSTADVPLLMANFNTKDGVLPNIMWIMDRLFKYTNFGIVSLLHEDYFITSGRESRDTTLDGLRNHLKTSFLKRNRKWMVLFPEGGFLHKRKSVSLRFAKKNNLPVLDYVTIPRVGAMKAIFDVMCNAKTDDEKLSLLLPKQNGTSKPSKEFLIENELSNDISILAKPVVQTSNAEQIETIQTHLLDYVLDITIAYPEQIPVSLMNIVFGLRDPCKTHMLYRLYKVSEIPSETTELTKWLYDRFIEKNTLLENFYKNGTFYTNRTVNSNVIQQDMLRFLMINLFFITSTYLHYQIVCTLYTYCTFLVTNSVS